MFFIAYAFKGQVHVFRGQVKYVSHLSCRTSAIMKYFCPLKANTVFDLITSVSTLLRSAVAQLVEHLTRDQRVAGLSLTGGEVSMLCP